MSWLGLWYLFFPYIWYFIDMSPIHYNATVHSRLKWQQPHREPLKRKADRHKRTVPEGRGPSNSVIPKKCKAIEDQQ